MKPEKLIITTTVGDKTKTELWDTGSPLGIGHPFRWVLETTPQGLRVRDLTGPSHQVRKDATVKVHADVLEKGHRLPLPGAEADKISLTIRKAHIPKPAYASRALKEGVTGSVPQLQVFEGVRRSLLNSQGVHSAYVAYSKGRPVFTVYHNSGGFRVKPLLNGVHLKLKGEKAIQGKAGEFWDVTRDQMTRATIVRGWYWWRFSLIEVPAFIDENDESDAITLTENRVFRNTLIGVSAMLSAAILFSLFNTVPPEEKKEEPVRPQVVKLIRKMPMNVHKGKVEVAVAKPTVDVDHTSAQEAAKSGENKENKKKGHTNVTKTPAKATAAVQSPKVAPPSPHVSTKAAAPGPKPVKPEKTGAQKVADSAAALRNAMGAASGLTSKDTMEKVSGGQANVGDLFAKSGAAFSPTDVKAGKMGGAGATVHGAGGGGGGGGGNVAAGEGGGGVGYGEGDKGLVSGKGGGFVSLDNGGSEVEEGLTKEEVGRVIHEHMSEVRYCHEAALLANPKVEGKLMLKFTINAGGVVETVAVQSSNLPDQSLPSCIMRRLVTWKFPHPKGGVKVNVAYPFLFKLLGGV